MSYDNRPNREESARPKRRTLEDELQAGKLNMVGTPDPDRYYHVVNDDGQKIERMKRRGYRIEDGKTVTLGDDNNSGREGVAEATANPGSKNTQAVLMSIEREFKDEDDAYRQSMVDKTEDQFYRNEENDEGRYGTIKKE